MPVRVSLLMSVTTDPTDRTSASSHSGGWSESFYVAGNTFLTLAGLFQPWGQARANLLGGECTVIGYRQQLFTISGNKILPGGSASGVLNIPGAFPTDLSAPQQALMMNFTVLNQPNTTRHRIAGIPGSQVTRGEYQPVSSYKAAVTRYASFAALAFSAVTRDLSLPDARVTSLAGGVLTTQSTTGAAVGDYIILRRVRDENNLPVTGSYLVAVVTPVAGGSFQYTLVNAPPQTVSKPNGTCRKDVLVINDITGGTPNRLVVRKVGRPFVLYRGRRSKRPL